MAETTPAAEPQRATPVRGLVMFGAAALILVGAFNFLDGLVALTRPESFTDDLLVGSLTAWGWAFLVFGAAQALVGLAVLRGSEIALWPGIVLVAANAVAQIAFLRAYPAWSIAIMALDGLVIYAFLVRGMAAGVEDAY
jgi:hypothetical protein